MSRRGSINVDLEDCEYKPGMLLPEDMDAEADIMKLLKGEEVKKIGAKPDWIEDNINVHKKHVNSVETKENI
jgi:hypothetical protein